MSVTTLFEIRFIFDASKPITGEEREYLLTAVHTWGRFRSRSHRNAHEDVKMLTAAVEQMPEEAEPPMLPATNGQVGSTYARHEAELADSRTYRERLLEHDREAITKALRSSKTVAEAARKMGMDYRTIYRKLGSCGINPRKELMRDLK